ncbi:hypothetical protein [Streptomyces cinnamoneus]|uniref:Secreted protein n=1 Tax=Streptomyces cinnamoneus TaxID=53446 RepID=A0A918WRK3_STRCJ|nr:hypothetical protein [Streptomyces cinnamoneus]GHC70093.1 hypothetical protein GCM10010507_56040 [Streptomyces cinnamoneus]
MRSRKLAYGAAALGSAALLCLSQQSASAATPVAWSAQYGGASASGTRWLESAGTGTQLKIQGEVKNTDSGCYSVWTTWHYDFTTLPSQKLASLCGPGTKSFTGSQRYNMLTTGSLAVCKGDDMKDCGPSVTMTSWPVKSAR